MNILKHIFIILSSFIIIFIYGCNELENEKTQIVVAAAASLTDITKDLKNLYEKENSNVEILFTYGSSGTLQNQIEEGNEIDIFISASKKQIDNLNQKGLLLSDTIFNIAENELVLIVPKNSNKNITSILDLTNDSIKTIALGDISSVPIGQYAHRVLEKMNIWEQVSDKAVYGTDVRQILTWVELSEADCGIVYATDAFISDKVEIIMNIDKKFSDTVIYQSAVLKDSKNIDIAKDISDFFKSEQAANIFRKYNFKRNE